MADDQHGLWIVVVLYLTLGGTGSIPDSEQQISLSAHSKQIGPYCVQILRATPFTSFVNLVCLRAEAYPCVNNFVTAGVRKIKMHVNGLIIMHLVNKFVLHVFLGGEGDGSDHRRQDYEERHASGLH